MKGAYRSSILGYDFDEYTMFVDDLLLDLACVPARYIKDYSNMYHLFESIA